MIAPMYAFLIEHKPTRRRIMFDLGPRKDPEKYPPAVANLLVRDRYMQIFVPQDITEQLIEGDIPLKSIGTVIWSHAHFDHTGDMSKFPGTTELVVGQNTVKDTYPSNPDAQLLESDFSGHKVTDVVFDGSNLRIGGFRAVDYLGDGSLYLLDVPGHMPGHMAGLARVTPTTFLCLGGDASHHPGEMRPTEKLHRQQPCPEELLEATRRTFSTEYFQPVHEDGTFDLANRKEPLLRVKEKAFYQDPQATRESIRKLGDFDANDDIFIMTTHDGSLMPLVDKYPARLNLWKEKEWKRKGVWGFVDETNPAFRFNALQLTKV
ncbi:beta-lactamase-like protein [Lyophyllum atratum]|nr:beta-lactamase-like protein [Lyophyllum atratum]